MCAHELQKDSQTQHVDLRLFFPADTDRDGFIDRVGFALQGPGLEDLTSAYEMVADNRPIA